MEYPEKAPGSWFPISSALVVDTSRGVNQWLEELCLHLSETAFKIKIYIYISLTKRACDYKMNLNYHITQKNLETEKKKERAFGWRKGGTEVCLSFKCVSMKHMKSILFRFIRTFKKREDKFPENYSA